MAIILTLLRLIHIVASVVWVGGGIFVISIVTVVTLSSSVTHVKVMKLHQSMVKDLLSQGYSVDDIERLTMGH